jgi:hypothetical protein
MSKIQSLSRCVSRTAALWPTYNPQDRKVGATCDSTPFFGKYDIAEWVGCARAVTVPSEIAFRFLLSVQLPGGLFLGLLALTPCLFSLSNVPHSPVQRFTALLT